MLLIMQECLCVMVVGDDEEISAAAQEFLECLFLYSGKHCVKFDVSDIFGRFVLFLRLDCWAIRDHIYKH